ncbi:MAG: GntR family transcriptional regulator [Rhodobacteraceae bacterium]|nr:GntR family transcriptional regulator [Paracoccaceae bacterium]
MSAPKRSASAVRPRKNHLDLAQRILEIARDRGWQAGAHLPEQGLANQCNVSRTPVRAALKVLAEQGFADWQADTGYRLAAGFDGTGMAIEALPNAEDAQLAQRIIRDRAARRLDETVTAGEVMRRYGQGRSAVQKALALLSEDGLLSRAPGQAWVFAPLPDAPESQADSFDFRLILEPAAILGAGFRLDQDKAAALRRRMDDFAARRDEALEPSDFQKIDTEFHGLIARGAGNRYVTEALLAHLRLRELPGAVARTNVVRLRQAMQEHLGILDQLESGRFDVAADLMRVHLRLSRSLRPQAANRGAPPLRGMTGRPGA